MNSNANDDANNDDDNDDNANNDANGDPPKDDQSLGCTTTGRSGATWMGLLLGLLILLRRR